jgi:DNA-directed RNA polymerase subunit RPC12/RpoP
MSWGLGMGGFDEKLELADKEVERIVNILRRVTGPKRILISEPNLEQPCYRCKQPMCSVDEANKNTYVQCFACGHRELEL